MAVRTVRKLVGVILVGTSMMAGAAEIDWSDRTYSFYLDDEPVSSVLEEIAGREGIPVRIDDDIQATVSGRFEELSGDEVFARLTGAYNLQWYYDGYVLYIDRVGDAVSDTIHLKSMTVQAFTQKLERLGARDPRFLLKGVDREGVVLVSGPSAYVDKVRSIASTLENSARRYDVLFTWTDDEGQTHFSNDISNAPDSADTVRVPRQTPQSSSVSSSPIEPVAFRGGDGK